MKKTGFTLIELLVVVAITAILAALLFPAFARAREHGRKAACVSNMRQIGYLFEMYRERWDGEAPLLWWYSGKPLGDGSIQQFVSENWADMIHDGTLKMTWTSRGEDIWRCPSALDAPAENQFQHNRAVWSSYSINEHLYEGPAIEISRPDLGKGFFSYYRQSSFTPEDKDQTLLLLDTRYVTGDRMIWKTVFFGESDPSYMPVVLHGNKRSNFLFYDGHVKSLRAADTYYPVDLWDPAPVSRRFRYQPWQLRYIRPEYR
jgi:prepilin-type N-terminal cleavage/methylation domain-containing protein/prepilin-type processing-associated H-X9-DG protein